MYCSLHQDEWINYLPIAEFTHNQRAHESTKMSPFMLLYGYDPIAIPTALPRSNIPTVESHVKELQKKRDEALAAHELSCQVMMRHIKGNYQPFKIGDKVLLEARNLNIPGTIRFFQQKRLGPFTIIEQIGPIAYRLKLPLKWKIHPVFHASLLTHYHENDIHGPNYERPSPDIIEGSEEFEVEKIIQHRKIGNQWQYFVKWKGYPSADNSWEPESNLDNAEDTLVQYKMKKKLD